MRIDAHARIVKVSKRRLRSALNLENHGNLLSVLARGRRAENPGLLPLNSRWLNGPTTSNIMSSLSRMLYTGVTNDLGSRVSEHKEGTRLSHGERNYYPARGEFPSEHSMIPAWI
jgi:hypothetical protein